MLSFYNLDNRRDRIKLLNGVEVEFYENKMIKILVFS